MKRPKDITLENAGAIYDWHENTDSSTRFVQGIGWLADKLLGTQYGFLDNTKSAIEENAHSGRGSAVSLSHAEWIDPGHFVKVCRQEEGLRGILDHVVVPAGAGWSNLPVIGATIMRAGTVTTFREDDVYRRQGLPRTQENENARLAANRRMVEITVKKYNKGYHVPFFPEGTRNRGNQREIQSIKGGMIRAINEINAADGPGIMVVCMSVFYGDSPYGKKSLRELRDAAVGIGHIGLDPGENLNTDDVHYRMQECLDLAINLHESRETRKDMLPFESRV